MEMAVVQQRHQLVGDGVVGVNAQVHTTNQGSFQHCHYIGSD
jgi:hypothetical protein